jgi:hypothetical protein
MTRLEIERIKMTHPASHKEINHLLGGVGPKRQGTYFTRCREQIVRSHAEKTGSGELKKVTAVQIVFNH